MTSDTLIEILTQVVNAHHFDKRLYEDAFRAMRGERKRNKLLTSIANTLEEYYNYHNRVPILGGANEALPPDAEDEKEELKLYIEALRQGVTDFRSLKDLKAKLHQSHRV